MISWQGYGQSLFFHLGVLGLIWVLYQQEPPAPLFEIASEVFFEEAALAPNPDPRPAPVVAPTPAVPAPVLPPTPKKEAEAIRSAKLKSTNPKPVPPKKAEASPKAEGSPLPGSNATSIAAPSPPVETTSTSEPTGAGGAPAGTGLLKNQLNKRSYQSLLKQIVQAHWETPPVEADYRILVRCTITPDGRIDDLEIKEPSGFELLDQAAKKAILTSQPLPPPPREFLVNGSYEAWFRFSPEEG